MNCVILQPSYIPWRGYFHQIKKADVFVFLDDVQFDRHGWRNRNRVKTQQGPKWLTIPVQSKGAVEHSIPIHEIKISPDPSWSRRHFATLTQAYSKSPFFGRYQSLLQQIYSQEWNLLADFTIAFTKTIALELGISNIDFLRSSELDISGGQTDRLIQILQRLGASHYISGPSAMDYLDQEAFRLNQITLEFMRYEYPTYEQLHPPFDGQVSVLDLMFMKGDKAGTYIWGQQQ